MPDKLTDSKIVKALSNMTYGGHYCAKCKYDNGKGEDRCGLKGCKIARYALDLINRLQAENERLNKDKENLAYSFANAVGQKMTAKAEAYTECIEKAKEEIYHQPHSRSLETSGERARIIKIFDNLLKELVGE